MSEFYYEYIKFELRVLQKLHTRKKLLETDQQMKGIEDVSEDAPKPTSKMSESVPSIVYATSSQSITSQFRTNVALHFRIKELVSKFADKIDVEQLLAHINEHITSVLYVECKSEVMAYLLKATRDIDQVSGCVDEFVQKTIPDLKSFQVLVDHLANAEAQVTQKYEIVAKFYGKITKSEDLSLQEGCAVVFLQFVESLDDKDIDVSQVLEDLHVKYPANFPILVHYCKHNLLKGEFEQNDILQQRDYLKKLTEAINQRQNSKEGMLDQLTCSS